MKETKFPPLDSLNELGMQSLISALPKFSHAELREGAVSFFLSATTKSIRADFDGKSVLCKKLGKLLGQIWTTADIGFWADPISEFSNASNGCVKEFCSEVLLAGVESDKVKAYVIQSSDFYGDENALASLLMQKLSAADVMPYLKETHEYVWMLASKDKISHDDFVAEWDSVSNIGSWVWVAFSGVFPSNICKKILSFENGAYHLCKALEVKVRMTESVPHDFVSLEEKEKRLILPFMSDESARPLIEAAILSKKGFSPATRQCL